MNEQIKHLQDSINALQAQLDALKAKPEAEKWEPEGGQFTITSRGAIDECATEERYRAFGVERKTREAAEKAAAAMRAHNRLLAYVAEFAPDYEPDWSNHAVKKYAVHFCYAVKLWEYSFNLVANPLGIVHMPKDVAIELCRKLNSGEVVL